MPLSIHIQVYGVVYEIPLEGAVIQPGQNAPAYIFEGRAMLPQLNKELTEHCIGNGTIFSIGDYHFVSLHINHWHFS